MNNKSRSNVVYIAGPITGTTDYMERFKQAEDQLRDAGYTPVNPTIVSKTLLAAGCKYEEFMRVTHELLKVCGAILLLFEWESSKGALRELKYALENGYDVYCETSETFCLPITCPNCKHYFSVYNYSGKRKMKISYCPSCGASLLPEGSEANEANIST